MDTRWPLWIVVTLFYNALRMPLSHCALPARIAVRLQEDAVILRDNARSTGTIVIALSHQRVFDAANYGTDVMSRQIFEESLLELLRTFTDNLPLYPRWVNENEREIMKSSDTEEMLTKYRGQSTWRNFGHIRPKNRLTKRDVGSLIKIVKHLPDIVNGVVFAVKTGHTFYSQQKMKRNVARLYKFYEKYEHWDYLNFVQDLLRRYKEDMQMLFVNKMLSGGFIEDLAEEFMTATNVTSLFGATQLIVATPVAANLLQTTEGDLFMRIYIDMSYPDPGSMRHGRLYTVVDTGVYDQNLHLFAHHFIHPFQMQFEEGDRNFFAVHDCHFPRGLAIRACKQGTTATETMGLSEDTIHYYNGHKDVKIVLDPLRGPINSTHETAIAVKLSLKTLSDPSTRQSACDSMDGTAEKKLLCDQFYLQHMRTCRIEHMEDECPYRVVTIPHPDVHNFFYIRKFPDVAYVYTDSPDIDVCKKGAKQNATFDSCNKQNLDGFAITGFALAGDEYLKINNDRYAGSYSTLPTIYYKNGLDLIQKQYIKFEPRPTTNRYGKKFEYLLNSIVGKEATNQRESGLSAYIYEPIAITLDNADAEEREITKLKWQLGGGLLTLVSSVIVAIIACWKYKNKVARSIVMGSFVHILEKHLQMTLIEGINRVRWIDQIVRQYMAPDVGANVVPKVSYERASSLDEAYSDEDDTDAASIGPSAEDDVQTSDDEA